MGHIRKLIVFVRIVVTDLARTVEGQIGVLGG